MFFAHRLRDDRRRDGGRRCSAGLPPNFFGALGAQVHPAGDGDRRRDAGHARRGIPRRRATPPRSPAGASSSRSSQRHRIPVVVAGFEPLDILAALVSLAEMIRDGQAEVVEHVSALRHAAKATATRSSSSGGVPADRRPLARHRARAERQPAAARRVRARRRAPPLHHRRRVALGRRAVDARRGSASAATSWPASRRRATARCSAASACRMRRSAPAWSAAKGTCRIWHQYGGVPDLRTTPRHARCVLRTVTRRRASSLKHGAGGRAMRAADRGGLPRAPSRPSRRRPAGSASAMDDGARGPHRRPLAGHDHRLARHPAALLSRRRHRPPRRSAARSTTWR